MSAVAELLRPQEVLTPDDLLLAELIELGEPDLEALTVTHMHHLGSISLPGEVDHPVIRVHVGPEGTIKRGGTKFKAYSSVEAWTQDGIDHGRSMFYKIGGIGKTQYGGGKTIADIDPRPSRLRPDQQQERLEDALDQLAGLVVDAKLADPRRDGTAGDEGTNAEMGRSFLRGLVSRNVPHAEACVTGKPDMRTRPSATGRGAAIALRTQMRLRGETHGSIAVQGTGFAGAYFAAEAYAPYDSRDGDVSLAPAALGDIDPKTKTKLTLTTDNPDGLPITRELVDALLDPTDRHVRGAKGNKLAALAWKLEDRGESVGIVEQDVLTFDPGSKWRNTILAPAATSNVIRRDNVGDIKIKRWAEIGNHTVEEELAGRLGELGIDFSPGELFNVGGVDMSIEENQRDLAKIEAAESGTLYLPVSDHEYEGRLRTTMMDTTQRAHRVAAHYNVSLQSAIKMVSLGNYAVANNMHISSDMFHLLYL